MLTSLSKVASDENESGTYSNALLNGTLHLLTRSVIDLQHNLAFVNEKSPHKPGSAAKKRLRSREPQGR
jgi:hypothetical protein